MQPQGDEAGPSQRGTPDENDMLPRMTTLMINKNSEDTKKIFEKIAGVLIKYSDLLLNMGKATIATPLSGAYYSSATTTATNVI